MIFLLTPYRPFLSGGDMEFLVDGSVWIILPRKQKAKNDGKKSNQSLKRLAFGRSRLGNVGLQRPCPLSR